MKTPDITEILHSYSAGERTHLDELFNGIYNELKKIANREKRRFIGVDTMSTSDLVNEAYIKLVRADGLNATNRAHFFSIAASAMRQIMINYLEGKHALKRGGDLEKVSLVAVVDDKAPNIETVLSIDRALKTLNEYDPVLAKLVEMRFFAGLKESEIALVMGSSERTVRRNWKKAKALLQICLERDAT